MASWVRWGNVEMFYQIKLNFSFVLTKIVIWYQNSKNYTSITPGFVPKIDHLSCLMVLNVLHHKYAFAKFFTKGISSSTLTLDKK